MYRLVEKKMTSFPRKKVLVVDDDQEFLEEIHEMLTLSGYDVIVASNAEAAMDQVVTHKPQIVFTDLKMTPTSGFQLAEDILNSLGGKNVDIIAMTGFFTEKEYDLLMKIFGIKRCILKPIKPLDLIANIEFGLQEK